MRKLSIMLIIALFALLPLAAQTPVTCGTVISAPGLYVLAGDTACTISIFIKSDDVTLNLKGHTLSNGGAALITGIVTSVGVGSPLSFTTNGTTIRNGTITGFGTAIGLSGPIGPGVPRTTNAKVQNVTLTGNVCGIYVNYASDVVISNNVITGSEAAGGYGIAANDMLDSQIKNNDVADNDHGIRLSSSTDNVVMKNTAIDNGIGILVAGGTADNVIKENKAKANSLDLKDLNANCGSNVWTKNKFVTSDPVGCID